MREEKEGVDEGVREENEGVGTRNWKGRERRMTGKDRRKTVGRNTNSRKVRKTRGN